MATELESYAILRASIMLKLAALLGQEGLQKDYSIDGVSSSWNAYRDHLFDLLDKIREQEARAAPGGMVVTRVRNGR